MIKKKEKSTRSIDSASLSPLETPYTSKKVVSPMPLPASSLNLKVEGHVNQGSWQPKDCDPPMYCNLQSTQDEAAISATSLYLALEIMI